MNVVMAEGKIVLACLRMDGRIRFLGGCHEAEGRGQEGVEG